MLVAMSTHVSPVGALDFESEVTKSDKLVIADFWAEWCGPCKMIAPLLDEVAREQSDKVKIVKINVEHEPQLAQKFGISNIPTLLFFKGGVVLEQIVGGVAKKVSRSVAEHRLVRTVDVDRAPVGADQRHADSGAFHHLAKQGAALIEAENLRVRLLDGRGHLAEAGSGSLIGGLFRPA